MLIPFDYIVRKYGRPQGILHVGANVGEEAAAYAKNGVKKVCWIEGNPEIIPELTATAEKYGHQVIHALIGDKDADNVVLHVSNNASQSSSILELGTHKIVHPEVHYMKDVVLNMKRLDSIGTWNGFDFLNIDLQGAELKALRGLGEELKRFRFAYLEVNKDELYKGCPLIEDLDVYLIGFGFKRVETRWAGNTGWGDALWIKK